MMQRWIRRARPTRYVPGDGGGRIVSEAVGPEPGDAPAGSDVAAVGTDVSRWWRATPDAPAARAGGGGDLAAVMLVAVAGLAVARPWTRGALLPADRRTPTGPSPAGGTRRCSTRSAARSRTRPSTRATCSTCPSRCGTRGPPTTTRRRGYLVTEKHRRRRRGRRAQRGDQLRRLPAADQPLHRRRRAPTTPCGVRGPHGRARLLARRHHDRGRHAGRRGQPHRRRGARGGRNRRLQRSRQLRRPRATRPSTRRWSGEPGRDDGRSEPLAAARAREHGRRRTASRWPGLQQAHRSALGRRQGVRAAAGAGAPVRRSTRARRRSWASRRPSAYKAQVLEVLRLSSRLDPADGGRSTSRPAPWATTRSAPTTAPGTRSTR